MSGHVYGVLYAHEPTDTLVPKCEQSTLGGEAGVTLVLDVSGGAAILHTTEERLETVAKAITGYLEQRRAQKEEVAASV